MNKQNDEYSLETLPVKVIEKYFSPVHEEEDYWVAGGFRISEIVGMGEQEIKEHKGHLDYGTMIDIMDDQNPDWESWELRDYHVARIAYLMRNDNGTPHILISRNEESEYGIFPKDAHQLAAHCLNNIGSVVDVMVTRGKGLEKVSTSELVFTLQNAK